MKGFSVAFIRTIHFDGRNISLKANYKIKPHVVKAAFLPQMLAHIFGFSKKSNQFFGRSHSHANRKLCPMFCFVFLRNVCILFRWQMHSHTAWLGSWRWDWAPVYWFHYAVRYVPECSFCDDDGMLTASPSTSQFDKQRVEYKQWHLNIQIDHNPRKRLSVVLCLWMGLCHFDCLSTFDFSS